MDNILYKGFCTQGLFQFIRTTGYCFCDRISIAVVLALGSDTVPYTLGHKIAFAPNSLALKRNISTRAEVDPNVLPLLLWQSLCNCTVPIPLF